MDVARFVANERGRMDHESCRHCGSRVTYESPRVCYCPNCRTSFRTESDRPPFRLALVVTIRK